MKTNTLYVSEIVEELLENYETEYALGKKATAKEQLEILIRLASCPFQLLKQAEIEQNAEEITAIHSLSQLLKDAKESLLALNQQIACTN